MQYYILIYKGIVVKDNNSNKGLIYLTKLSNRKTIFKLYSNLTKSSNLAFKKAS
jgi:hypothetical protein